jgi:hypothetical protein
MHLYMCFPRLQLSFEGVCMGDVGEEMRLCVESVEGLLGISADLATALLHHFQWNEPALQS